MKKATIVLAFLLSLPCYAQTDNTLYVKQFPGSDVGTKVANAINSCKLNPSVSCILVIDPSLSSFPSGSMPSISGKETIFDYRNGVQISGPFGVQSFNSIIEAQPGTGTINAAYASLLALGFPGGEIFLPCGTYIDNFQPSEPVKIEGVAPTCVTVEPLDPTKPALGMQILTYVKSYSVSHGTVTINAPNAFVSGETVWGEGFTTSPGSTCLSNDIQLTIAQSTPTQFTIAGTSCADATLQLETAALFATQYQGYSLKNITLKCPGGSCTDAIQIQGRVDKDWITDNQIVQNINIQPGFLNGVHIIGRSIQALYENINQASDGSSSGNAGFLVDTSVPGCSGTNALCNGLYAVVNETTIDHSLFSGNYNWGIALTNPSGGPGGSLGFLIENTAAQGNGHSGEANCADLFVANIENLSVRSSYFENGCPGTPGAGSAEIRVTGTNMDNLELRNNIIDISASIPPIYTDSTFLSGNFVGNRCVGGTPAQIVTNQPKGLAGGSFEWGENGCQAPIVSVNASGQAGVTSGPFFLGQGLMNSGTSTDVTNVSLVLLYNGVSLQNITGGSIGRRITIMGSLGSASTVVNNAGGAGQIGLMGGVNLTLAQGYSIDLLCSAVSGNTCTWTQITQPVHGTSGRLFQASDGTGTSGPVYFASDGSTTSTISPGKQLANCGTMTTTAASSNSLSCSWVSTSSNCTVTPSNSTAVPWTYFTPFAGSVTVYHASTAGANYAIACSAN